MFKFHDDPTVYESGITILLRDIWMYAEKKKKVLEEKEEKTKLREKCKIYYNCKN